MTFLTRLQSTTHDTRPRGLPRERTKIELLFRRATSARSPSFRFLRSCLSAIISLRQDGTTVPKLVCDSTRLYRSL